MKKQTLIYAAAGAAAIAAIYLLTKKPVTNTVTPKADPVPPKLTELQRRDLNIIMLKMSQWLDSVLPPAPKDNSGYYEINCITSPCPQPTFSDKAMKEHAAYQIKVSEYQNLRTKYQGLFMALNPIESYNEYPQADLLKRIQERGGGGYFGKQDYTVTCPDGTKDVSSNGVIGPCMGHGAFTPVPTPTTKPNPFDFIDDFGYLKFKYGSGLIN